MEVNILELKSTEFYVYNYISCCFSSCHTSLFPAMLPCPIVKLEQTREYIHMTENGDFSEYCESFPVLLLLRCYCMLEHLMFTICLMSYLSFKELLVPWRILQVSCTFMWLPQGGAWDMDLAESRRHVNAPFTWAEEEESSSLAPSFLPRPNPVPHLWFEHWRAKKKEIFTRAPGFRPKSLSFRILAK